MPRQQNIPDDWIIIIYIYIYHKLPGYSWWRWMAGQCDHLQCRNFADTASTSSDNWIFPQCRLIKMGAHLKWIKDELLNECRTPSSFTGPDLWREFTWESVLKFLITPGDEDKQINKSEHNQRYVENVYWPWFLTRVLKFLIPGQEDMLMEIWFFNDKPRYLLQV